MIRRDTILQLDNCTKKYGNKVILKDVSFRVDSGKLCAIIGKSGAGKTTLLNIIGTIDLDYEGDFQLNKKNIRKLNDKEVSRVRNEEIGFVFQSYHLLPNYSVFENMLIPLSYSKKKLGDEEELINIVLSELNIIELKNKKASELSGGEKQRVAIARALINKPSILIADEPTGNLDEENSEIVMDIFKGVSTKGVTVIVVTHDTRIAKYCDEIFVIKDRTVKKIKNQLL